MNKNTNGRYDTEFKKMIVKKYEDGADVDKLCKDFELKDKTVYRWIKQYSSMPARGNAAKPKESISPYEKSKMEKEIKDLKQEVEILKKCINIFSRK